MIAATKVVPLSRVHSAIVRFSCALSHFRACVIVDEKDTINATSIYFEALSTSTSVDNSSDATAYNDYAVYFEEPANPNGVILSYTVTIVRIMALFRCNDITEYTEEFGDELYQQRMHEYLLSGETKRRATGRISDLRPRHYNLRQGSRQCLRRNTGRRLDWPHWFTRCGINHIFETSTFPQRRLPSALHVFYWLAP